jgi:hypothetical protein
VRWIVTLSASRPDAERLAAESLPGLSAAGDDPRELLLELDDLGSDVPDEDAPQAAKAVIDRSVRHINGSGKLRWGRAFEGVAVSAVKSVDSDGRITQHVWPEPAVKHMLPEDFADLVERLGHERPALPVGLEVLNALDVADVTLLAETNPDVGRVLYLVALMLEGDDEINWVAAYSALEAIRHDLAGRQLKGEELGWWTDAELRNFRATANSVEMLGPSARHGKPFGLSEARMTAKDAGWLVRRVGAHWITYLLRVH